MPGTVPLQLSLPPEPNGEERSLNLKRYETRLFKDWLESQGFQVLEHLIGTERSDPFGSYGLTLLTLKPQ